MRRAFLNFPIAPDPQHERGDFLVRGAGGWRPFAERYAWPAIEELGWSGILLHQPFGRSTVADEQGNRTFQPGAMEFDQAILAEQTDSILARDFWMAWQPLCLKYPGSVISYLGCLHANMRLRERLRSGRPGMALRYILDALEPVLGVYGMELGLDAALREEDGEDDLTPALVRLLEAPGLDQRVWIEPHPFRDQPWAFDMRVITGVRGKRAWKRAWTQHTGEKLVSPQVYWGEFRQDDARKWAGDFVAANQRVIRAEIAPCESVLVERGDQIVANKLTPADFGIDFPGD